ncbi:spindle and centriole-associated protein 1 isoform X2 [Amia ocellicauda]|uniref:spindle and centriole-associated protein 1 isoform X2 n=1 Tax=Amia ocellicauda TaxID=2972642 RepID=UPI0034647959
MSFVRVNRSYQPHGLGKRTGRARKKTSARQEWVSTVHDLSVHRATPEELNRRHEMHRSKNRAAAQWELRERALRRKLRRQGPASPDPLDRAKLAIMREVLADQYQMQEVLERSDRAMAVVKDLFGDAPRRKTGFPNVTVAPDCDLETSVLPVLQRPEPPTQLSILSQSVLNSQALNELGEDSLSDGEPEDSKEARSPSVSAISNMDMGRYSQYLQEEDPPTQDRRPADKQQSRLHPSTAPDTAVTPRTPHNAALSSGVQAALNATAKVRRVRPQRQGTEQSPASPSRLSTLVTHVLNPDAPRPRTGRKSQSSRSLRRRCEQPPVLDSSALTSLSGNQSSLELLQDMLGEVEQELDSLDLHGSQELPPTAERPHRAPGLTGFSVSLVSTLRRLAQHLRQSEGVLQQETVERRRLEDETQEQRRLIDALTAEMLALREESAAMQAQLQQHTAMTEHQLSSLRQELRALGGKSDVAEPQPNPAPTGAPLAAGSAASDGVLLVETMPCPDRESVEQQPPSRALPPHLFHSAVLLSPPRQRDSQPPRTAPSVVRNVFVESQDPNHREQGVDRERSGPGWEAACQSTQDELEELSVASSFASLPRSGLLPTAGFRVAEPPTTMWKQGTEAAASRKQERPQLSQTQDSLLSHIAELSLQNSLIRAQLGQIRAQPGEAVVTQEHRSPVTGPTATAKGVPSSGTEQQVALPLPSLSSVEQRIAELNRQSAEARGRLLELIEQQRQVSSVSPSISPIPTHEPHKAGNGGRMLEVSIPQPDMDSSTGTTPSSVGRSCGRRSAGSGTGSRTGSPLSTSMGEGRTVSSQHRAQTHKLKNEGWFALSTHIK